VEAQELSLSCFDRVTWKMIPEKAKVAGFDAASKPGLTAKYEASANPRKKADGSIFG